MSSVPGSTPNDRTDMLVINPASTNPPPRDPNRHLHHFLLPLQLSQNQKQHKINALIDSGATFNIIDRELVKRLEFSCQPSRYPTSVTGPDGMVFSQVSEECQLQVTIKGHSESLVFEVGNIPSISVVLGRPWLRLHNPYIDWVQDTIMFRSNHCQSNCQQKPTVVIQGVKPTDTQDTVATIDNSKIPLVYRDYSDVFAKENAELLPEHRTFDCGIELVPNASPPPLRKLYQLSKSETDELRTYIQDMESKGFIRKSKSQFGAPVFYVPKKDGSRRLCVDYRGLNAITVKDRYPIPLTKQLLESLSQSTIFTKIDLRSAYHLVRIQPGDEHKTAFRCRYGHYEYLVMPFGLANAPSIFMRLIQQALSEYLDIFAVVYLDDILVYSRNVTDHVPHVRLVLASLRKFQLYAKLEKCDFHQESIEFLGYIISKDGFRMAPSKVKSIAEWPTPMSVKQVQSFLGLANFYRIFIRNFPRFVDL